MISLSLCSPLVETLEGPRQCNNCETRKGYEHSHLGKKKRMYLLVRIYALSLLETFFTGAAAYDPQQVSCMSQTGPSSFIVDSSHRDRTMYHLVAGFATGV